MADGLWAVELAATLKKPRVELELLPSALDPLGINHVSGFYGPGAWAGWLITILCSFYNVARRHTQPKRLQDTLVFVLVMNWAAIDLFRQTGLARSEEDQSKAKEFQGRIAAALLISYWGLICAVIQIFMCLGEADIRQDKKVSARCIILLAGSYVPSMALTHLYRFLQRNVRLRDVEATHWENTLPALAGEHSEAEFHARLLQSIALFGLWWTITVSSLMASLLLPIVRDLLSKKRITKPDMTLDHIGASMAAAFLAAFIIFCVLSVEGGWKIFWIFFAPLWFVNYFILIIIMPPYHLLTIGVGAAIGEPSCFMVPCAPQKMTEWDQSFALFLSLFLAASEIGTDVVREWRERHSDGDLEASVVFNRLDVV